LWNRAAEHKPPVADRECALANRNNAGSSGSPSLADPLDTYRDLEFYLAADDAAQSATGRF
jgi:hypothetical protein